MIFNVRFSFFSDAKSISGRGKVLKKIHQLLIDKYGEHSVSLLDELNFTVFFENESWEKLLYRLIEFAQSIGQQWVITGSVDFEFSLWSNNSKIIGVSSIGIGVDNVNHP